MTGDRGADANRMSAQSYARGDPDGWFETLYAEAAQGRAIVPWDHDTPNPQLAEWLRAGDGAGRTAVVVGCGLGTDAQFVASRGFTTTAFDLSVSAVQGARERHPDSTVRYEVADLFALPAQWRGAFDLVVESYTVQSLPDPPRRDAIPAVSALVAPGGELVVIAAAGDLEGPSGPPFPLTRREIDAFAVDGLRAESVEDLLDDSGTRRWRAVFHRLA
jgi:2-polyprenyl-3-methyl-5-hydroxy-6-metoxy-1,4-benzoquinol methylase